MTPERVQAIERMADLDAFLVVDNRPKPRAGLLPMALRLTGSRQSWGLYVRRGTAAESLRTLLLVAERDMDFRCARRRLF